VPVDEAAAGAHLPAMVSRDISLPFGVSMTVESNSRTHPGVGGPAAGPVVILVDNKVRDLTVAALIAHQLEADGIECFLEPLEAFRAAVGAHRPGMIVFNHLNGSQLVRWSQRLAEIGVLSAVLPNEGIVYDKTVREVLSGRFHRDAHVVNFFCWNEAHKESLLAQNIYNHTQIDVVGIPRFDVYFQPWSKVLPPVQPRRTGKPRVLLCTNFIFANFDKRQADRTFGSWQKYNPGAKDYWGAVLSHRKSREQALKFAEALLDDGRFELVLRPHPNENRVFYEDWLAALPGAKRAGVVYAPTDNISALILDCDVQVACETCTTSIESWIAKKPTIALIFDKHPFHYNALHNAPNIPCNDPTVFADTVSHCLDEPVPQDKLALRLQHLETWCASPDGHSVERIAAAIGKALRSRPAPDWSKLDAGDFRRAAKLRMYQQLGQAYHYDPLLWLKGSLFPKRYAMKTRGYRKSILPSDVASARRLVEERLGRRGATKRAS
jgi:surface carbohydrate biosynthesis protein